MSADFPEQRPIVIALAGPNGAGKSTFFEAHLRSTGLHWVNADEIARELGVDPYRAAELADRTRRSLVAARENFVFETVLSDPEQEKVAFLREAASDGYAVVLCFIGLESPALSDQRVALRTLQGGHDVPVEKLNARYPRSLANLTHAIQQLPLVKVYDNSVEMEPHRRVADFYQGRLQRLDLPIPTWFSPIVAPFVRNTEYQITDVEVAGDRECLRLESADGSTVTLTQPSSPMRSERGERVTLALSQGRPVRSRNTGNPGIER